MDSLWCNELAKDDIAPVGGDWREPQFGDFLATLQSSSKGNFVLVEGGYLLDSVDADDLPQLADHLYGMLVDATGTDETRDPTLDEVCDQLIRETGLDRDPYFQSRYPVTCRVAEGTDKPYEFSHAYGRHTATPVPENALLEEEDALPQDGPRFGLDVREGHRRGNHRPEPGRRVGVCHR